MSLRKAGARQSDRRIGIEVQYLSRTDDIEPGDISITSGSGGVFPRGVRVGVISEIERRAFSLPESKSPSRGRFRTDRRSDDLEPALAGDHQL